MTAKVSTLKKKADTLFSKAIRLSEADDNGMVECITCGAKKHWKTIQAGHFVSRRVNVLRYDSENVNPQCYSCNVMRYGEQYIYAQKLDKKYGEGTAEKLMSQRHQTHKFTISELEEIIHDSKEIIKFYEKEGE